MAKVAMYMTQIATANAPKKYTVRSSLSMGHPLQCLYLTI